jgi:predicted peroxiredoxin
MPRYYFHVRSNAGLEMDRQGLEFESIDDAIADARRAGAEMLLDEAVAEVRRLVPAQPEFEIADASGRVVARVPFTG